MLLASMPFSVVLKHMKPYNIILYLAVIKK
jgi:hypothetical protein